MKFFAVAALVATVVALPATELEARTGSGYNACEGGLRARCCSTDVLGLLGLDCKTPSVTLTSANTFRETCKNQGGRQARCCALPLLSQAVLCEDPVGIHN
ncbi:Trihydrophobin-like protein [Paramyrothecium foliicola]|nr:Trihydrophobin-like protein [Paramyrothecium foliicola]